MRCINVGGEVDADHLETNSDQQSLPTQSLAHRPIVDKRCQVFTPLIRMAKVVKKFE
jgi:hypothetical protein